MKFLFHTKQRVLLRSFKLAFSKVHGREALERYFGPHCGFELTFMTSNHYVFSVTIRVEDIEHEYDLAKFYKGNKGDCVYIISAGSDSLTQEFKKKIVLELMNLTRNRRKQQLVTTVSSPC